MKTNNFNYEDCNMDVLALLEHDYQKNQGRSRRNNKHKDFVKRENRKLKKNKNNKWN